MVSSELEASALRFSRIRTSQIEFEANSPEHRSRVWQEVKANQEKGELTEKIIRRELQFQEKKIQMRLSERKMAGLGRKLRSISRESMYTSPSASFEVISVQQRSESNAVTSRTHEKLMGGFQERPVQTRPKMGRSMRNKSQIFNVVTEETEDDLRISMPSQREVSKSKSTRLS